MNCKLGDMAVHIGGYSGAKSRNSGKIVKCVEFLGEVPGFTGIRWKVEGASIITTDGYIYDHADDRFLRPIRPDETPEQSAEAMRLLTQLPKKETA